MEINRNMYEKLIILIVLVFMTGIISGCGKKFWDYECVWVSDSPYIYMPAYSHSHKATIEINGEKKDVETAWENTGLGIKFCTSDIKYKTLDENLIWDTECEVKKGKLYITIIKDNVSDMEGKTIVLEQQPLENESDEE